MELLELVMVGLTFVCMFCWMADFFYWKRKAEIPSPYPNTSSFLGKWGMIRIILFILGMISFLLFIRAFSSPKVELSPKVANYVSNDLFLIVDVSRSMLANDFRPNRLEQAKLSIKEFLNYRPSERIGIILFSEKILTLVPLTHDEKSLQKSLNAIQVGKLGDGTNIGDALALGIAKLKTSTALHKTLILLTDGVGQVDSVTPVEAASWAKQLGIQIFTIGMGRDPKALIPVPSYEGTIYAPIPGGSFDEELLQQLAEVTGGRFFRAVDNESLQMTFNFLRDHQKKQLDDNSRKIYQEKSYPYFFMATILLLLVETVRRFTLKELL